MFIFLHLSFFFRRLTLLSPSLSFSLCLFTSSHICLCLLLQYSIFLLCLLFLSFSVYSFSLHLRLLFHLIHFFYLLCLSFLPSVSIISVSVTFSPGTYISFSICFFNILPSHLSPSLFDLFSSPHFSTNGPDRLGLSL
jgi:hypothetical protein